MNAQNSYNVLFGLNDNIGTQLEINSLQDQLNNLSGGNLQDGSIKPIKMQSQNAPVNGYSLAYDSASQNFYWKDDSDVFDLPSNNHEVLRSDGTNNKVFSKIDNNLIVDDTISSLKLSDNSFPASKLVNNIDVDTKLALSSVSFDKMQNDLDLSKYSSNVGLADNVIQYDTGTGIVSAQKVQDKHINDNSLSVNKHVLPTGTSNEKLGKLMMINTGETAMEYNFLREEHFTNIPDGIIPFPKFNPFVGAPDYYVSQFLGGNFTIGLLSHSNLDSSNSPILGEILSYDGTKFVWIANEFISIISTPDTVLNTSNLGIKQYSKMRNELFDLNSINANRLEDATIINTKIASGNIITSHIQDLNVTNNKLSLNAVSESKISDLAISENKLQNFSVTQQKLGLNMNLDSNIADFSINGLTKIAVDTIYTNLLQNFAVTPIKMNISNSGVNGYVLSYDNGAMLWVDPGSGGDLPDNYFDQAKVLSKFQSDAINSTGLQQIIQNGSFITSVLLSKFPAGCFNSTFIEQVFLNDSFNFNFINTKFINNCFTQSLVDVKFTSSSIKSDKLNVSGIQENTRYLRLSASPGFLDSALLLEKYNTTDSIQHTLPIALMDAINGNFKSQNVLTYTTTFQPSVSVSGIWTFYTPQNFGGIGNIYSKYINNQWNKSSSTNTGNIQLSIGLTDTLQMFYAPEDVGSGNLNSYWVDNDTLTDPSYTTVAPWVALGSTVGLVLSSNKLSKFEPRKKNCLQKNYWQQLQEIDCITHKKKAYQNYDLTGCDQQKIDRINKKKEQTHLSLDVDQLKEKDIFSSCFMPKYDNKKDIQDQKNEFEVTGLTGIALYQLVVYLILAMQNLQKTVIEPLQISYQRPEQRKELIQKVTKISQEETLDIINQSSSIPMSSIRGQLSDGIVIQKDGMLTTISSLDVFQLDQAISLITDLQNENQEMKQTMKLQTSTINNLQNTVQKQKEQIQQILTSMNSLQMRMSSNNL